MARTDLDREIGLTIRDLRLEKGMTQVDLAAHLNVSQGLVSMLEAGEVSLSLPRAENLATLFHTTAQDIFTGAVWEKPLVKQS